MAHKTTESDARWNKKATTSQPATLQAVSGGRGNGGSRTLEDEIRRRAYEMYLQRGNAPGSQRDDWLAAEREIRGRVVAAGERR
jgi:Protein of unknown function (DUF2934)